MRITNDSTSFGMKHIESLSSWAIKNKDKVIKIDPEKIAKANESIKEALKNSKIERQKASESASKILLTI